MYPREVTEKILELEAKGYTLELTRQWFIENRNITIHRNTIHNHRHGATAQEIIEEMARQQQQDITIQREKNPELALKYRNELLKILLPVRVESLNKNLTLSQTTVKHVVELVDPDNPTSSDQIQTS